MITEGIYQKPAHGLAAADVVQLCPLLDAGDQLLRQSRAQEWVLAGGRTTLFFFGCTLIFDFFAMKIV